MDTEEKSQNRRSRALPRRALMLGGILAVAVVGIYFYLTSGRFIDTDNAYIKASKILVTPEVAGTIVSVSVSDNQPVARGDTLFRIDPTAYRIAVDQAQAEVVNVKAQIEQLKASYREKQEDLARAEVEVAYTTKEYNRRLGLVKSGAVTESQLNERKRQRDAAVKAIAVLKEEINGILAALVDDPDIRQDDHPLVQKAAAELRQAQLNLERTTIRAPVDGLIGSAPSAGDYARAGVPLLNLVGNQNVWIEANYKETELTNVKVGQPVTIEVDTYPDREWQGHVESISPATGSEFSILPAQNATGNWVKVVQRIAVRIAIDQDKKDLPLRTGMSSHVTIDIGRYPNPLMQHAFAGEG